MEQMNLLEQIDQTQSICPYCKKNFKIKLNKTYCSRSCKEKQYEVLRKEIVKNRTLIGFCLECKKVFKRYPSSRKYCSEKCSEPYVIKSQRIRAKRYRNKNIEKVSKREKEYRAKNIEKIKERRRLWGIKNKEKVLEYRAKNKEKKSKQVKEYRAKNIEKIKERMRLYRIRVKERTNEQVKERRKNDIQFKIKSILRCRLRYALKPQNGIKTKKTLELIGCSWQEAMDHIQSQFKEGMTWENHGYKGWHIDHIIPCASFDLSDPEQQKKCFHYTNLQPLWWYENLSKGDRILEEYTKDTV
jgi:hypothetical protein